MFCKEERKFMLVEGGSRMDFGFFGEIERRLVLLGFGV